MCVCFLGMWLVEGLVCKYRKRRGGGEEGEKERRGEDFGWA